MGLESLNPIGAIIGGATDLFKTFYGLGQMISGNKKLNELEANRPQYQVDPNILYNQQLAGQMASEGLPSSAKNWYTDSIERGLGSTIQAAKDTGQGLGSITNAFGSANDSFRNLLAMDAESKMAKQQLLMGAKRELRDENLRAWDINQNIPFQQKYSRYTNQTNAGAQNLFGGGMGLGADAAYGFNNFGGNKQSGTGGYDTGNMWYNYMMNQPPMYDNNSNGTQYNNYG